jgi:hypothetical protein
VNRYKSEFQKYESQVLLQKRALGDELNDEAHIAIEEIFAERGEPLPPRPLSPVIVESRNKGDATLKVVGGFLFFFLAATAAKVVTNSWLLFPVVVLYAAYFIFKLLRKSTLSPEQREEEDIEQKAKDEALTELMITAAKGNTERVKELLAYGADVNAKSSSGTTALMYAARNNQTDVVQHLLSAGANINDRSKKGASALSLAEKFGHLDLCQKLKDAGAKQ